MTDEQFFDYIEKEHPRIKDLMLQRQEEAGNTRNWDVFKEDRYANIGKGGFFWRDTIEDHYFWENIIIGKDTSIFYYNYPNPKEIEMW
jgi:hypothetical protein